MSWFVLYQMQFEVVVIIITIGYSYLQFPACFTITAACEEKNKVHIFIKNISVCVFVCVHDGKYVGA